MATLTLKNVPEALVERLKAEAKQSRRSLNQEALVRLETSLVFAHRDVKTQVALLRAARTNLAHLPPIRADFIARAKTLGRR